MQVRRDFEILCLHGLLLAYFDAEVSLLLARCLKNPILHYAYSYQKNKSLHSGLMFCFRIVQGYMEIFPVLFPSLILVSVGILKICSQTSASTCLCRNLRSFSESYVDRFFLFKIWLIDKERIQRNLWQIYASTVQQSFKKSEFNKQANYLWFWFS